MKPAFNAELAYDYINFYEDYENCMQYFRMVSYGSPVFDMFLELLRIIETNINFSPDNLTKFVTFVSDGYFDKATEMIEEVEQNPSTNLPSAYTYTISKVYRTPSGPEIEALNQYENELEAVMAYKRSKDLFCFLERTETRLDGTIIHAEYDDSTGNWLEGKY